MICNYLSFFRYFFYKRLQIRQVSYMYNKRIILRSPFGFKYFGNSLFGKRIRAESVHSFRGKSTQTAVFNCICSLLWCG